MGIVFSTFQFVITMLLVGISARAMSLSDGDLPVLTFIIPALWLLPRGGVAGVILLALLTLYGWTLSGQPIALSIAIWTLFPVLQVMFSPRSSWGVITTTAFIVLALEVGVMMTQANGGLAGSATMTLLQALSVGGLWWTIRHWRPSTQHHWWSLGLVAPLWLADQPYAVLIALCAVALFSLFETLSRCDSESMKWSQLLAWTLPSIGFASLVVMPDIDVPHAAFVVWVGLLGTAWMTDYLLRNFDESEEI